VSQAGERQGGGEGEREGVGGDIWVSDACGHPGKQVAEGWLRVRRGVACTREVVGGKGKVGVPAPSGPHTVASQWAEGLGGVADQPTHATCTWVG
jgi:hypothetical protein